jgi:hypothetical protein
MTGFIRGLFSKKDKEEKVEERLAKPDKPGEFFLDNDSAKTFGDIDYMRTAKSVRKTYPKGDDLEVTESISAMEKRDVTEMTEVKKPKKAESSAPKPTTASTPDRRSSEGGGMDMFRKMAKDINKKP